MSCRIVTVERQLTAVVKTKVPFAEIATAQRSARSSLAAALPTLQVGRIGRPCTRFHTPAQSALEMEVGTIVGQSFPPKGEIVSSDLPAGRAAHLLLKGSFEGLPAAWQSLFDWCKAQKLDLLGINWEIYSPWEGVDPDRLETDLYALLG